MRLSIPEFEKYNKSVEELDEMPLRDLAVSFLVLVEVNDLLYDMTKRYQAGLRRRLEPGMYLVEGVIIEVVGDGPTKVVQVVGRVEDL